MFTMNLKRHEDLQHLTASSRKVVPHFSLMVFFAERNRFYSIDVHNFPAPVNVHVSVLNRRTQFPNTG